MKKAESRIVLAGLMPHAPVLIPAVSGGRETEVAGSVAALRELSRRIMAAGPKRMVVISPHSPRRSGAFGVWQDRRLSGDLGQFGCLDVRVDLPNDPEQVEALKGASRARSVSLWEIHGNRLDHGALVPLYFLAEAGWGGPTMVLSLNYPEEGGLEELGACLAEVAARNDGPVVVVASGDMSHRLKPGAPAGYNTEAVKFDETFVELVRHGRYAELTQIDPMLQDMAAEDVVDSTRVAVASVDYQNARHQVLHYEGPFGVGYCVAVLFQAHENSLAT